MLGGVYNLVDELDDQEPGVAWRVGQSALAVMLAALHLVDKALGDAALGRLVS
ncbi:MAG: hypothetical protein V1724_08795 [Chloroflexota bacterium]